MGVDPEEVREEGLTTDELVDDYFVGPGDEGTTEVTVPPGWEEEDAGPDRWFEDDGTLVWMYDGFRIAVNNETFGKWRAKIEVPHSVSKWLVGPGGKDHEIKACFAPTVGDRREGYIEDVTDVDGDTVVTVYTATNFQPHVSLERLADDMREYAEEAEEGTEQVEAAFEAAKVNEKMQGDDGAAEE
jgi:hypothetical protein